MKKLWYNRRQIALDIPPVMEQEVRHCANARGVTFSQFVFELVEREVARFRTEKAKREERANATYEFLMAQDDGGLPRDWKFNREEAKARR